MGETVGMTLIAEFLLARYAEDETRVRGYILRDDAPYRRPLADLEAKRRIVALTLDRTSDRFTAGYAAAINSVLHELASPYSDHPDYREEWRP